VARNGKLLPDISAILLSLAVKLGRYSSFTPSLRQQSVTHAYNRAVTSLFARNGRTVGYVGVKSRQRWLFYAYDRMETVVAHVFGERTLATLEPPLGLLSAFEVVVWMTDGCAA
jgi:hypothetical protein